MSMPTRFTVLTDDMELIPNQSLFTLSYSADLKDRKVWLDAFKDFFAKAPKRYIPDWYEKLYGITVDGYGHTFYREELV